MRTYTGRFAYEWQSPNAALSAWANAGTRSGIGFAVVSFRGATVLSKAVTDVDGRFSVTVPTSPAPDDRVVVYAGELDRNNYWNLIVADPGLAAGSYATTATTSLPSPSVWGWEYPVGALPVDGNLPVVDEAHGAGAAFIYFITHVAFNNALRSYYSGRSGRRLIVWFRRGVSWTSCGTCNNTRPSGETAVTAFGTTFGAQTWVHGAEADHAWWSEAVHAHETGHWVMGSFSTPPREGGTHYANRASAPGLGWSEGFANWFAMSTRGSALPYVDKQGGVMFWFDFARRTASSGTWARASPSGGLLQMMPEAEITAMLWSMETDTTRHAPFFTALGSTRMIVAPFERGYTNTSGTNVPVFPDFLDALACSGFSLSRISAATLPYYPYDTATRRCR